MPQTRLLKPEAMAKVGVRRCMDSKFTLLPDEESGRSSGVSYAWFSSSDACAGI